MHKYEVQLRTYECHPETCCHWEHFPYWIVKLSPWKCSGLHGYSREWVQGFDSREEANAALKSFQKED